jgi:hypothetical protein
MNESYKTKGAAPFVQNLFEEYKFFPQYPDKELNITAQLFGGITVEEGNFELEG